MTTASAISRAALSLPGAAAAISAAPQRPTARSATKGAGPAGPSPKAGAAAKASGTSKVGGTAQTSVAAKSGATAKASTASKSSDTAKSSSTSKAGYAVKLPAEFAFLDDPKLSIEEKLSRFIGLMMTRSEQRLQAQMEKMAAGSSGADGGASSSGSKSSTSSSSAKSGFSLWSLAKALVPPLGLASSLLGDSTVKSLLGEVSGPVLAAAATALGMPELAPFALKLGPEVAKLVTSDTAVAAPWLDAGTASVAPAAAASGSSARPAPPSASGSKGATGTAGDGGEDGSTTGSSSGSTSTSGTAKSTSSSSSSSAKTATAEGSTSEKAQLLELQRLQDQDKELFALFSNMLKSMHDARMTAVQNIR